LRFNLSRMLFRFLHKVPSFRLLLPYLLGVVFISCHLKIAFSLFFLGIWGLILFGYIEQKMASPWNSRWLPGICFTCLWLSLGAFSSGYERKSSDFPTEPVKNIVAIVKIETPPVKKPKTFQCYVQIIQTEANGWKDKRLQLYIAKDSRAEKLGIGDLLLVKIKPQKPERPSDPKAFDFAAWLRNKGICATAYLPAYSWKNYSTASNANIFVQAERARSMLLERFKTAGISGEEFSLVSALTLGNTNLLTPETKQQFSVTGVSHILSVSGLHVAVIYAVLEFLLSFLNRFDKLKVFKQLLIMLLLWCYAFMTGLSPSVIRSAMMFSLIAMGGCLHRKAQTINTVLFSAFLLLLWKPSLLFDLGFELSYCAVLSIVVVQARLTRLWTPSSKIVLYFWEMICLSAVAQLGTSPLTLFYFHQFPNYFMLNNLVAVPFSALIIYLAVVFLFLFNVPILGGVITWCLNESLHLFQTFVESMSALPYALTKDIELEKMQVLALYALMGSFFIWFFLKRRKWVFAVLLCLLCLQGMALSYHFK
jgi:competence protein ComEC